ncbi:DNA polymerase delta subunit 4 [Naviculisporaceae sp. PSN 640]
MPPTTRKSARHSAGAGGKQSTLSFNHRVTKPVSAAGKSTKDNLVKPAPTVDIPSPAEVKEEESANNSRATTSEPVSPLIAEPKKAAEPKSEAELKAAKISDAAVNKYWNKIESSRMARDVHKKHGEGLTVGEKVLRYFDVSSQYGPCIGIDRLRRWKRAERLGLNPPIEVLAALIKEQERVDGKADRAHMDELMNSTAVGAA